MSYHFLPTCATHNEIAVAKDGTCPVCEGTLRWNVKRDAWEPTPADGRPSLIDTGPAEEKQP